MSVEKITNIVSAVSSAFSALAAVAIYWVYQAQTKTMRGQLTAAQATAKAAERQAQIAEKTIATLERPHLFAILEHNFCTVIQPLIQQRVPREPERAAAPIPLECFPSASLKIKNYGRSPAIIRQISASIVLGQDAGLQSARWLDLPAENVLLPGGVTPEMITEIMQPLSFAISSDTVWDLLAGEVYFWIFGTIIFDDVLSGESTHFFCWRFDYSTGAFEPAPPDRNYTEHRYREQPIPTVRPTRGAWRVSKPIPPIGPHTRSDLPA